MPYYVSADMPEWDEYQARTDYTAEPASLFKYADPWEAGTTVVPFPETPGSGQDALSHVSGLTGMCRALGVKRVFGKYDGGGDESFTHFQGIEMSDGRKIPAESLRGEAGDINCDELIENAVSAIMGEFDIGEFVLHGAISIDFDACTITDEKNADVVLGDKLPWEI